MLDKILNFLEEYYQSDSLDLTAKKSGKYKTITAGLSLLINRKSFTADELRKELSIYTKRIISQNEFNQLLDYDRVEYARILCEV